MKLSTLPFAAFVAILAIASSACSQSESSPAGPNAPDPARFDPVIQTPEYYRVLLEDDLVRVLDMSIPAGKSDSMHYQLDYGAYFLKGGQVRVHPLEAFSGDYDIPVGAPMIHEAWFHRVRNIGATDVQAVLVELRQRTEPDTAAVAGRTRAEQVAPDFYKVLDRDSFMRILELNLPAGASDGMIVHPDEVLYILDGGHVRFHLADGQSGDTELTPGSVLRHETRRQRIENIGETEFRAIIFELNPYSG